MSVTVTLPDVWLLIAPCGCIDGIRHSVIDGQVITATADEAWEKFTRLKHDRERERREGWTCVGGSIEDWDRAKGPCPHDPQYASPAGPDSGSGS